MPEKSAIEMLVLNPDYAIPEDQRGVIENLWIKQRFKEQYLSIGVYLEGSDLKYYFFKDCDKKPTRYSSLAHLIEDLPAELEDIFKNTPKLFMMGHGQGGYYGLSNHHDSSEQIEGKRFDQIINDFKDVLPNQHSEISVTLEACNADNRAQAKKNDQDKTFLERLSATHQNITFCGTGPWASDNDEETGYRAAGGISTLNVPITAMVGNIWKHGNSVIFYHDNYQIAVRKSMFASTETAKELKVNTVEYAREILKKTSMDDGTREEILKQICLSRDILKVEDLNRVSGFPQDKFEDQKLTVLMAGERHLLEKEKNNYLMRVREILSRAESRGKFTDRDILIIALGLKDLSVFDGHENLREEILANKALLQMVMVACGKVLIAGPSNDDIIALLLEHDISINSVDEKGMTALHYAVQNFFNYRKEPLNLINKLLDSGANIEAENKDGQTPLMLATDHSQKKIVKAGDIPVRLLKERLADAASVKSESRGRPRSVSDPHPTSRYFSEEKNMSQSPPKENLDRENPEENNESTRSLKK